MRWIIGEGVNFKRGNHAPLVAKFDNSKWIVPSFSATTQTQRAEFRKLGQRYGAKVCEVRLMYTEDDKLNFDTSNAVSFYEMYGEYRFRIEHKVPEGHRREFTYFNEYEVFSEGGEA